MENKLNDKQKNYKIKCEKQKIHTTYIVVISVILLVMGFVSASASETKFVSEFSFASTITSIILSVIAIWMSISGERTTNSIVNKIDDSMEHLLDTTKMAQKLNSEIINLFEQQKNFYKEMDDKFLEMSECMHGVKDDVAITKEKLLEKDFDKTITVNSDSKLEPNEIFERITYRMNAKVMRIISKSVIGASKLSTDKTKDTFNYMIELVRQYTKEENLSDNEGYICTGIVISLYKCGLVNSKFGKKLEEKLRLTDN